jgi:hypothetical protein
MTAAKRLILDGAGIERLNFTRRGRDKTVPAAPP